MMINYYSLMTVNVHSYCVADKTRRKPYLQGRLDAYCGIYSVVNAVHYLCGPLSSDQAAALLIKLMRYLEPNQSAFKRLTNGTTLKEINRAVNHCITRHYPIKSTKPFSRNKGVSIDDLWREITRFLATHRGIVILGMGGKHEHWSVVKKTTPTSLLLFDSVRLSRLSKLHCSTQESDEAVHVLQPTHVLFLWVTQPGGSK